MYPYVLSLLKHASVRAFLSTKNAISNPMSLSGRIPQFCSTLFGLIYTRTSIISGGEGEAQPR